MTTDADLDSTLLSLDAAPTHLTDDQHDRKAALLAAILGDAAPVAGLVEARPRPSGRWVRALIPAAAAAAVVGMLILPGSTGAPPAYASWTPEARPVVGDALTRSSDACRAAMGGMAGPSGDEAPELRSDVRAETARTVVAEQRGDFLFVAMVTDSSATGECFLLAENPGRVVAMTGGAPTAATPPPVVLASDQIEAAGGGLASGPEGSYAFAGGRVGDEVRAVTIRVDGVTIQATVSDGSFAAWWPTRLVSEPTPSPILAYDVTLADGRILKDADPGFGQGRVPGPREIGRVEQGGGATDRGIVGTVAGYAGSEVVGVTVRVGDTSVTATVTDGVFSATWPSEGTDTQAPSYDLTLKDGTILHGQQPVSGAGS